MAIPRTGWRALACALALALLASCGGGSDGGSSDGGGGGGGDDVSVGDGGGGGGGGPAQPPAAQAIAYLKASNTGAHDHFGVAVALSADGNTLAVGANNEASGTTGVNSTPDESAPEAGAVYIFVRSGSTWAQQAYIKASNAGAGDQFGIALALSEHGSTLAVGAPGEDGGAVYVFQRSAGVWSQQAYVKASNAESNDRFGGAVALSLDGNTLAVGASQEDSGTTGVNSTPDESAMHAGAVYVFTRSAGVYSQQAYIKASNAGAGDFFGNAIALSANGNTLAVGAWGEAGGNAGVNSTPDDSTMSAGAVYVFTRSAGAWSQHAYLKASNPEMGDLFGHAVGLSADGNTLAIGATGEDSASAEAGSVYVFTRSAGAWSQQFHVRTANARPGDAFGSAVALSADGNKLAVGAFLEDSGTTGVNSTRDESAMDAGAAYVFTRSGGAWSQQSYVKASNTRAHQRFGWALAISAGGNTLAIGAFLENSGTTGVNSTPDESAAHAGAVYLYY